MTDNELRDALGELDGFYGQHILNGGILEATWMAELSHLSLPQVHTAIARCFKKNPKQYGFFPSVDTILELVVANRTPGENSQAYRTADPSQAQLPSVEMSPEEKAKNRKAMLIAKLFLLSAPFLSKGENETFMLDMDKHNIHEIEQMITTCKKVSPCKKSVHAAAMSVFEEIVERVENELR